MLRRLGRALDEGAHDRALIARGEVGAARLELFRAQVPHRVEQCGLQAGEGEVQARDAGDGEAVRLRVALAGEPVDRGSAGVAEPQEPRTLVEGLTRRVVERRPEDREALAVTHVEKQRVAAARQQAEERRLTSWGWRKSEAT